LAASPFDPASRLVAPGTGPTSPVHYLTDEENFPTDWAGEGRVVPDPVLVHLERLRIKLPGWHGVLALPSRAYPESNCLTTGLDGALGSLVTRLVESEEQMANWLLVLLTLVITLFTYLVWKTYERIAWLTGAMETHSELMLRIEAKRGIRDNPIRHVPGLKFTPHARGGPCHLKLCTHKNPRHRTGAGGDRGGPNERPVSPTAFLVVATRNVTKSFAPLQAPLRFG
jgi:hypothetical protein